MKDNSVVEVVNLLIGMYLSNWPKELRGYQHNKASFFKAVFLPEVWLAKLPLIEILVSEEEVTLY
jgi:hypothetical protein